MSAPERPDEVPDDAEPVTVTLWMRAADADAVHRFWWPSGMADSATFGWVSDCGIPVPRPPRTGPLGLSEEDTREVAGITASKWDDSLPGRVWPALAAVCREQVAAWDAEDAR